MVTRRPWPLFLFALLLFSCTVDSTVSPPPKSLPSEVTSSRPRLISYDSGGKTLHGFIYKPNGPGPFPAMLWNHGSEPLPGWQPQLAKFYVDHGYVFFIPHRTGQGRSPGQSLVDLQRDTDNDGRVELHERSNRDVVAALEWLRQQPFVDGRRVVMSGCSFGGIQTLLTAEKGLGLRAFVPFAPAAMSWEANPLLGARLVAALKNAQAPVFLIQAQNDFSLEPSRVLGPELKNKGPPNQSRVYPAFGTTHLEGHGAFACTEAGIQVWGEDVLAFLNAANPPSSLPER